MPSEQYHRENFDSLYGPYFSYDEFRCKCRQCSPDQWNYKGGEFQAFMIKLMALREELGFPFLINSGHRCPSYNDTLYVVKGHAPGGHMDGPHTRGAADIAVSFERAYDLIELAMSWGMGVGPTQHGDIKGRFVHIDNLGKRIWTY